jgi:uncharacterized protein (UPF0264 family)
VTRLLVSVRDAAEALAAAAAGADFIDLKDPATGALGGLPAQHIVAIVAALRAAGVDRPISATIGDLPSDRQTDALARVAAVAACGVDYVKVGVEPGADGLALIARLAACPAPVVPVLIADDGVDAALLARALSYEAFPALMLDTVRKGDGSLLQRVDRAALQGFVDAVRARSALAGLAGALRGDDLPALIALGPDFAGFRGAVCEAGRASALQAERVGELARRLRQGRPRGAMALQLS